MPEGVHHAARNEYRMVLAVIPFPANPMETRTGLLRPGTVTLRTRMEYAGEVAGQAGQVVEVKAVGRECQAQSLLAHCP
jgi:hypothetical protein